MYLKVIAIIYKGNRIRLKSSKLIIHSFFRTVNLPIRMKAQAVDKFMQVERLKEEQILFKNENDEHSLSLLGKHFTRTSPEKMDINA